MMSTVIKGRTWQHLTMNIQRGHVFSRSTRGGMYGCELCAVTCQIGRQGELYRENSN